MVYILSRKWLNFSMTYNSTVKVKSPCSDNHTFSCIKTLVFIGTEFESSVLIPKGVILQYLLHSQGERPNIFHFF